MNQVSFRFYEELNDFLPPGKKKSAFPYSFHGNPSIKDAIEALGVPHVDVDLILVNNSSVDFSYKLKNGDSISVYPVFESFDITSVTHLREKPLRDLKFIMDVHLGKLSKYMHICGFDVLYRNDYDQNEIIHKALTEKRIILTRNTDLLKNKKIIHGYRVRSQHLDEQLKEVILRFDLINKIQLFIRCLICNEMLIEISKEEIIDKLLPKTRKYYQHFKKCPSCNRIYWQGSHYEKMKVHIEKIINQL